ncbi:MAG: CotH kinase family protein, partial [Planctomycetota bacterium]
MMAIPLSFGRLIDEIRYHDSGVWSRWADGKGPSLELIDLRGDNAVGSSWSESSHEAAWHEVDVTRELIGSVLDPEVHVYLMGAGEVLVDDLSFQRVGTENELIANGNFDGEEPLSSWRIEGTHIDSGVEMDGGPDGSNALRIVASKRGDTRVNRLETQTLLNVTRGEYRVRFKARWIRGSRLLMVRVHGHRLAYVHQLSVPEHGGTPGRRNSRHRDNVAPSLSNLSQEPALPQVGESIRFEIDASDPDGLESVELFYRLDGQRAYESISLRDDGEGGDTLAGDEVYAASVEGFGEAGAIAEFYVKARDTRGLVRTLPEGGATDAFLFSFDDNVPAHEVPAMRVLLRDRDLSILRARSVHSNERLPSSLVTSSDHVFYGAGIRYRGSVYVRRDQFTGNRKGFRVNLPPHTPYRGDERIVLDEQQADDTRQADRMVRLFLQRAGGIPYGERRYVHLIFPGAEDLGTYEQVLAVDGAYLDRAFGDEGASGGLYKLDTHYELSDTDEFNSFTSTAWRTAPDKERIRFTYKKRSREDEDDFSEILSLLELMDPDQTRDEDFEANVESRLDLDAWLRSIAVYRAAEDWDTIGGWTGKNVYLYGHPDGRWRIIP